MDNVVNAQQVLSSDGKHLDRVSLATAGIVISAGDLAWKLTQLLGHYAQSVPQDVSSRPSINSGYRTPAANIAAGGAKNSAHLWGLAVDFTDSSRLLTEWVLTNIGYLQQYGLWVEDPYSTPTWLHIQSRPVPSCESRIFMP